MEEFKTQHANVPPAERNPNQPTAEANRELRSIVNAASELTKEQRVLVFKRMNSGPSFQPSTELEAANDNVFTKELEPFFEQIGAVEEKYGRDIVAELAGLYGADRV